MGVIDIYIGEYLNIWRDEELAYLTVYSNGLTFTVPLEHLAELFSEFAQAQASFQIQEISKN